MARVSSQKTRQALLVVGDPLDEDFLPEKLELFNEAGEPISLGGGYSRQEQAEATGMIDPADVQSDLLTAYPGIRLFKIKTNYPARVRVYPTEEMRLADLSRSIGRRPTGNNGRLLEVVTTASVLELTLSPEVDMMSKAAFFTDFYVSITNLDIVARAIEVTYYYVRTE